MDEKKGSARWTKLRLAMRFGHACDKLKTRGLKLIQVSWYY